MSILVERMGMSMSSEQTNELATALAKAQAIMKPAVFDKVNPHFKSKYASLASVNDAIRKPLTDNSICWFHSSHRNDTGWILTTYLQHTSGQWRASEYPLPSNVSPQAFQSQLTYGKRSNLTNLTGVAADEDDDANEAVKSGVTVRNDGARKKYGNPSEDFMENDDIYDAEGNPVDNIPAIDGGVEPTTKNKDARSLHSQLLAEIRSGDSLQALELWAKLKANQIRVASLPVQWQDLVRDAYRTRQNELGRSKS